MTHDDNNDKRPDFDAIAGGIIERHGAKLDAEPATAPIADAAAARRRHLGDRAEVLLAGEFPPRLVEFLLADKRIETHATKHAADFVANELTILALTGGTGAGKTLAGCWIAQEVGGTRPGFIRATRLERAGRYDRDLDAWLRSRTMLVIDDLGVEFLDGKGAFISILDELVDIAWCRRTRLVFTANLDAKGLAERLGQRIWSRVADVGMVGPCGATDLRRVKR